MHSVYFLAVFYTPMIHCCSPILVLLIQCVFVEMPLHLLCTNWFHYLHNAFPYTLYNATTLYFDSNFYFPNITSTILQLTICNISSPTLIHHLVYSKLQHMVYKMFDSFLFSFFPYFSLFLFTSVLIFYHIHSFCSIFQY